MDFEHKQAIRNIVDEIVAQELEARLANIEFKVTVGGRMVDFECKIEDETAFVEVLNPLFFHDTDTVAMVQECPKEEAV